MFLDCETQMDPHMENMQALHSKVPADISDRAFSPLGKSTNHYTTVQIPFLAYFYYFTNFLWVKFRF